MLWVGVHQKLRELEGALLPRPPPRKKKDLQEKMVRLYILMANLMGQVECK